MMFHFRLHFSCAINRMTMNREIKAAEELKAFRVPQWLIGFQLLLTVASCLLPVTWMCFCLPHYVKNSKLMTSHVSSRSVLLVKCSVKWINKSSEALQLWLITFLFSRSSGSIRAANVTQSYRFKFCIHLSLPTDDLNMLNSKFRLFQKQFALVKQTLKARKQLNFIHSLLTRFTIIAAITW